MAEEQSASKAQTSAPPTDTTQQMISMRGLFVLKQYLENPKLLPTAFEYQSNKHMTH